MSACCHRDGCLLEQTIHQSEDAQGSQLRILLVLFRSELTETPAQTEMAPEPVPVLERPMKSRGKGPLTAHAQNLQHTTVSRPLLVGFTDVGAGAC